MRQRRFNRALVAASLALGFGAGAADATAAPWPAMPPAPPFEVRAEPCYAFAEARACATTRWTYANGEDEYRATIYLPDTETHFTYLHEVGHVIVNYALDPRERDVLDTMRPFSWQGIGWNVSLDDADQRAATSELVADAYAHCRRGDRPRRINRRPGWLWAQTTPYLPSDRTHTTVCRFLAEALATPRDYAGEVLAEQAPDW